MSRLVDNYMHEQELKRENRIKFLLIAGFCLIMTTIVFWGMLK